MTVEKADLISLLTNRRVFNEQYIYNTIQVLRHLSKDRLAIFLWAVLLVFLSYEAVKISVFVYITITLLIAFFISFFYYAFRAHAYETFVKERERLEMSFEVKILEGTIGAIYIPKTTLEISEQIKHFLSDNSILSEHVQWILNTRFRRGIRSTFRKTEDLVAKAVKDKYGIDIEFNIANLEQELVYLSGLKVTQAYNNYGQWRTLEIRTTDIPWLICKIITILMLVGSLLFITALCMGSIG